MWSDFLVIGGGMAGASAGYFLADFGRVTVLEMEQHRIAKVKIEALAQDPAADAAEPTR